MHSLGLQLVLVHSVASVGSMYSQAYSMDPIDCVDSEYILVLGSLYSTNSDMDPVGPHDSAAPSP